MTTDLIVREQRPYELTDKQVNIIANTEFVPREKRGKLDLIWASIFHGRSIGIDDMTAIQKIHIINGVPGLAAVLASGIAAKRGHKIEGEMSATSATAHGVRGDNGAEMTVTFTMEDAKAAGLATKQVYKQHPQSMLWARAVTQLCRSLFPDCFIGGVYTREELGEDYVDDADLLDGDVIEHEPFDSGELPTSEDEARSLGLTEPVDEPTGMSVSSPGSVSPLDQVIGTFGRDAVGAAGRELFPGRSAKSLTDQEIEELTDHLKAAGVGV